MISPVLGRKAVSGCDADTDVRFVKCVMPLQVMAVANRNGLKSRAIRGVAPADPPPPACCSLYHDHAEGNTAPASGAAGVDEKPFPTSIDVASSVLLTPLQRVCMQPACRIIAQASTMRCF
jgi:hypothetical protein